ncbi:MAG: RsmE family RNA methyltransferase [Eubacteriales bacterium]|nr:RsmE family RNA methyltransferase [Eubacteriales bacterium]
MHSFYIDIIHNKKAILNKEDAHHARRVLRLKDGEEIAVVSNGIRYSAKYSTEDSAVYITGKLPSNEPQVKITLYQGFAKGDRMDYIVQKCTEIGVNAIVPVYFSRCVVQDADKKIPRLNRIAREAASQSQRNVIPTVHNAISVEMLAEALAEHEQAIIPWEEAKGKGLRQIYKGAKDVAIIIGPEGGIAPEEINMLQAEPITLGQRILRTETAGLVAAAGIFLLSGDLE